MKSLFFIVGLIIVIALAFGIFSFMFGNKEVKVDNEASLTSLIEQLASLNNTNNIIIINQNMNNITGKIIPFN